MPFPEPIPNAVADDDGTMVIPSLHSPDYAYSQSDNRMQIVGWKLNSSPSRLDAGLVRANRLYVNHAGPIVPAPPPTFADVIDLSELVRDDYYANANVFDIGAGGNVMVTSIAPTSPTLFPGVSAIYDGRGVSARGASYHDLIINANCAVRTVGATVTANNYCWVKIGWRFVDPPGMPWNWLDGQSIWYPGRASLGDFAYQTVPTQAHLLFTTDPDGDSVWIEFTVAAYSQLVGSQYQANANSTITIDPTLRTHHNLEIA